jgi:hypothetical protein
MNNIATIPGLVKLVSSDVKKQGFDKNEET